MPYAGVAPVNAFLRDDPRFQDLLRRLNLPLGKANRGLSVISEGFWEGFAANRCKGMQKHEKGRASNHVSLQRFAKESNERQRLAKNLKTAERKPLGVDLRTGGGRCSVRSRALHVESPAHPWTAAVSHQPTADN